MKRFEDAPEINTMKSALRQLRDWLSRSRLALLVKGRATARALPSLQTGARQRISSDARAIGYRAGSTGDPSGLRATVVAFYLPQFHPVPENDQWWGKGFTEWTNVTRALAQFEGHDQPHLPSELGFYDLRVPQVMEQQVRLARQYGVGAFCFYYYWFNGKRILEHPVDHYLRTPDLDLPFCLCWANESWTRRWDGRNEEVLLQQQHSGHDDLAFIASVAPFMRDPRYLSLDGHPLLILYRAELLPNPRSTAERWRTYCREQGLGEIHLACVESFARDDPRQHGFDSAIEFPPNLVRAGSTKSTAATFNREYMGEILDWRKMAAQFRCRSRPDYPLFRGVNVAWDNEPRQPGRGRSFIHSAPRRYEDWLRDSIDEAVADETQKKPALVFVNAWNEWAEGAHLEPDARLGHAWLEATRRANMDTQQPAIERPCVVVHAHHLDVVSEILIALREAEFEHRLILTTSQENYDSVRSIVARFDRAIELRAFNNRGRDILPFLHIADELIDQGEQLVLKLHTKRSPHLSNGAEWRRDLLLQLLAPQYLMPILEAFKTKPRLGLVGPAGHLLDVQSHLGGNKQALEMLMRRIGISQSEARSMLFFAGSMFWIRLKALRPLLDAHLFPEDFSVESGQLDGTLAHALERLIPAIVLDSGHEFATSSRPLLAATSADSAEVGTYRYAP